MLRFLGKDDCVMYRPDGFHAPSFNAVDHVVSSVVVQPQTSRHETVLIWNRGALCGSFSVLRGDGEAVAARLLREPEEAR